MRSNVYISTYIIMKPFQVKKELVNTRIMPWHCMVCNKYLRYGRNYYFIWREEPWHDGSFGWTCLNKRCVEMFILREM